MDAFEKWWNAHGLEVVPSHADAFRAGMRAAAIAGTMAERPYDTEPEFSAVLAVESAILAEADKP